MSTACATARGGSAGTHDVRVHEEVQKDFRLRSRVGQTDVYELEKVDRLRTHARVRVDEVPGRDLPRELVRVEGERADLLPVYLECERRIPCAIEKAVHIHRGAWSKEGSDRYVNSSVIYFLPWKDTDAVTSSPVTVVECQVLLNELK